MVRKLALTSKPLLIAAAIVIFVAAGYIIHRHNSPKVSPVPTATITQLPNHTSASDRTDSNQLNKPAGSGQGIGEDTHGTDSNVNTPSNQWTRSASGLLTLKQPVSGSMLSTGTTISGSAEVSQVYYRLIDDKSGVISQGVLEVASGNFSGKIVFYSHGDSGRLDVYSLDGSGREINEIQILVKF